ncbi:MAG: hypothetical protein M1840_007737 [Geoglossum simile]|nr:MAG: hypothetical protein M1840_007737 [Geoglossum simile]
MPNSSIPDSLNAEFESLDAARHASCKFGIRASALKEPKFRVTQFTPHTVEADSELGQLVRMLPLVFLHMSRHPKQSIEYSTHRHPKRSTIPVAYTSIEIFDKFIQLRFLQSAIDKLLLIIEKFFLAKFEVRNGYSMEILVLHIIKHGGHMRH